MENESKLILSNEDFQKLSALLFNSNFESAEFLEEELDRAEVVPQEELPADVVSMNSTVRFIDQTNSKESEVTLVYPHDANIEEHKISIFSPVGAALIGLRVGQSITWPLRDGKTKELKVVSVTNPLFAQNTEDR